MRFESVGKDGENRQAKRRWPGALCGLGLSFAVCVALVMPQTTPAAANQRQYPVVALTCDTDLNLCRALVQVLSEMTPTHLYRINPKPRPPRAFDLRLDAGLAGSAQSAHLTWPTGTGRRVARGGHTEAEFARHIVKASPGLADAIRKAL